MIVCFDLDDTLLNAVEEHFIPAYIEAISDYLSRFGARNCKQNLLFATQAMMLKDHPQLTLEEEFSMNFFPGIGVSRQDLQHQIDRFYEIEYPKLRGIAAVNHDAINLVRCLLAEGHEIVIATNPLFPCTAIMQRLEWAGLSEFIPEFKVITTFERFHFAKPNPAYFSEILAILGWPESKIVMVGNSLEMDILPAVKIGIPSFWLKAEPAAPDLPALIRVGSLKHVPAWLDDIHNNQAANLHVTEEVLLSHLKATPAAMGQLHQVADRISGSKGQVHGQSSTVELFHLLAVERELLQIGVSQLAQMDSANYPTVHSELSIEKQSLAESDQEMLFEFIKLRTAFTNEVKCLIAKNSQTMPKCGTDTFDLQTLMQSIVQHDQFHLRQAVNRHGQISL